MIEHEHLNNIFLTLTTGCSTTIYVDARTQSFKIFNTGQVIGMATKHIRFCIATNQDITTRRRRLKGKTTEGVKVNLYDTK